MKVHWWTPFGDGGPGGRVLCGRPLRSGVTGGGSSLSSRSAIRTTRIPAEVTCRRCLHRMAAYGDAPP